jgi:hypothetical protein
VFYSHRFRNFGGAVVETARSSWDGLRGGSASTPSTFHSDRFSTNAQRTAHVDRPLRDRYGMPETETKIETELTKWRDELILVRDLRIPAERSALYRAVERNEYVKVARGVYLRSALWETLDRHARYRTRVMAAGAVLGDDVTFSRESAAAMWRLPWAGPWPHRVHAVTDAATGGRSNHLVARHATGLDPEGVLIDDVRVTSLLRTVLDVAAAVPFGQAVTAADAALRRTRHPKDGVPGTTLSRACLLNELDSIPLRRGRAKARAVVEFADGNADRPGESISRVNMWRTGLPMPLLQVALAGASGREWTVDFWWPEFNLIGEFDGRWKYTDPEFLNGRTGEQALLDEKHREDDLRAADHRVSRWGWEVAMSPARLRRHLVDAGLRTAC